MGLGSFIKKAAGFAVGAFTGGGLGGWGSILGMGFDLYGLYQGRQQSKDQEKNAKAELEAISEATKVQTARDITDLERSREKTLSSVTAMAAAAGVRVDAGTPKTVRGAVWEEYEVGIERVREDAKLRSKSLTLAQNYAGQVCLLYTSPSPRDS